MVHVHCVSLQRITCTVNSQEQKRLLMDLDVSMRTGNCPYTVHFYGALFREVSESMRDVMRADFPALYRFDNSTQKLTVHIIILAFSIEKTISCTVVPATGGHPLFRAKVTSRGR